MIATNSLPTLDGRVATPGVLPKPVLVLPPLQAVKLLDQIRERIRYLHYSPRTEDAYVYWIRPFIRFHKLRHPRELGAPEVEAFLSWLGNAREAANPPNLSPLPLVYAGRMRFDVMSRTRLGSTRDESLRGGAEQGDDVCDGGAHVADKQH